MTWSNFRWPKSLGIPSIIQKVRTEGVLTPLLWLCGLSFIATLIAAVIPSPVMWFFAIISGVSSIWVLKSFDHFRDKDPKFLQSEKFQLEWARQQKTIADRIADEAEVVDQTPVPNSHIESLRNGGTNE